MIKILKLYITGLIIVFALGQAKAVNREIDSLLTELKSKTGTAKADVLIALSYKTILTDTVKSDYYCNEALKLSLRSNYNRGVGWVYYLQGVRNSQQNKFLLTVNKETKAIEIGQSVNDYDLIARSFNVMGLANLRLEDEYNALKSFKSALAALEKARDKSFEGAFIGNIGIAYFKNKNFEEGLAYMKRASKMHLKSGNKVWLADSYLETGLAYDELKDYQQALSFGLDALRLAREVNVNLLEVRSLILLASVQLKLNRPGAAKAYLDEASEKVTQHNLPPEKLLLYKTYADIYEKLKDYSNAFRYQREYSELYELLNNAERQKTILAYQEKFQTEQKELENKLLREEQQSKDIQIKQKNILLNQTYVILIVFILFSLSIFWGNRRVRQKNRLLTLKSEEIQQQKEQVEHINQIKDKLFSVIAHDLRSPFASMKSMMDMYEEGMMSKEEVGYFFKEISKDIGTNNLLLDNLLAWAKSQLHGFKTDPKAVSLAAIVEEVLYHFNKLFHTKHLHVVNKVEDKGSYAHADYEMVKTIIRNIIGNAIKFTPKNGTITISCHNDNGVFTFSVTDSGIGIPQEQIEQLFQESFFTTRGLNKEKGTGLGLKICKEFVEKNNGSIRVESEPQKGTTVSFTLPESREKFKQNAGHTDTHENDTLALKQLIKTSTNLQNKYDRYELISKATNDIIWDSDLVTREISWNEALFSTFGHPFEKTSIDWWNEMVHPDDLMMVRKSLEIALNNHQATWECEYRFQCADKSYKYVFDRGLILFDDEGKAFRMIGLIQDIDVQKHAMRELQRLSLVATNVNNLVLITDDENKVVWVNHAFEKYTGYTLAEIVGTRPRSFLSGELTDRMIYERTDDCVKNRHPFSIEIIYYTKSGDPFWVQVDATPYDDPITLQKGYVAIQTVITERKKNEELILKKNTTLREIARISSHEVRRPLSSILGLATLLKLKFTPDELVEYIDLLNASSQQLDTLIHRIHQYIAEMEETEEV